MAKFVFEDIKTFWAPVKVIRPGGEIQEFEAQFVYIDDEQWKEFGQTPTGDFLREHWTDWRGITDAKDIELPFSAAQRDVFVKHTYILNAVMAAYIADRAGQRAKN